MISKTHGGTKCKSDLQVAPLMVKLLSDNWHGEATHTYQAPKGVLSPDVAAIDNICLRIERSCGYDCCCLSGEDWGECLEFGA